MADIWDNLNTKTISELPSEDIQRQSNPIHLEKRNRELLADVNLINQATLRDGRVMPDTNAFTTTTITDNGYGDGIVIMAPEKGQVLSLQAIGITANTAPSSSVTYYLFLQDRTLTNTSSSTAIYLDSVSSTSSNVPFSGTVVPDWRGLQVTYPMQLFMYVNNMHGVTTFTPKVAHYRVR